MCYKVVCKQCSKYTWGGCGGHLKSLYASIDKGKHCMCRSWPGVVIPSESGNSAAATVAGQAASGPGPNPTSSSSAGK